jgi:ubiquinone/menaquinone biosynthesis C-methylase UbiE
MAYGLRNLADPGGGLGELRRVLRPGGRAAVLDFNRPQGRVAAFQAAYLSTLVVPTASWFGLHEHYAYLEASLERFPDAETQEALARSAGFTHAHHRALAGGLMGLLELIA